jgi:transposase
VKQKTLLQETDRCGVKGKLNAEQLLILAELVEANNDATLEELRYLLYGRMGFSVSRATIALFCHSGKIKIRAQFLTVDIASI